MRSHKPTVRHIESSLFDHGAVKWAEWMEHAPDLKHNSWLRQTHHPALLGNARAMCPAGLLVQDPVLFDHRRRRRLRRPAQVVQCMQCMFSMPVHMDVGPKEQWHIRGLRPIFRSCTVMHACMHAGCVWVGGGGGGGERSMHVTFRLGTWLRPLLVPKVANVRRNHQHK